MSTLTQRFLNEVETNSATERAKIVAQLEALATAEKELGATAHEAERAAVQTLGKTLTPKPEAVMRLPLILQTAGIWSMTSYLLHYIYSAIFIFVVGRQQTLNPQNFNILSVYNIIPICLNFLIAIAATRSAIAWDKKMGFKGALLALGGMSMLTFVTLMSMTIVQNLQHPMPNDVIQKIPQMLLNNIIHLGMSAAGILATPHLMKWWEKRKGR
jgi:hypothetical protein